jgi:hypothetical protein
VGRDESWCVVKAGLRSAVAVSVCLSVVSVSSQSCIKKTTQADPDAIESSAVRKGGRDLVDRFYFAVAASDVPFPGANSSDPERQGNNILYGIACYNEPADPNATGTFGNTFEHRGDRTSPQARFYRQPAKRLDSRIYVHEFVSSWNTKANRELTEFPTCEVIFGALPKKGFEDAVIARPEKESLKAHEVYQEAIFNFSSGCLAFGLSILVSGGLVAGAVASQGILAGLAGIGGANLALNAAGALSNFLWCQGGLMGVTRNAALESSEASVLFNTAVHHARETTQALVYLGYEPDFLLKSSADGFTPLTQKQLQAWNERREGEKKPWEGIAPEHARLKTLLDEGRFAQAAAYYNMLFAQVFNRMSSGNVTAAAEVQVEKVLGSGFFGSGLSMKSLFSRHHVSSDVFFKHLRGLELTLEKMVDDSVGGAGHPNP